MEKRNGKSIREVRQTKRFRSDLKKMKRRGKDLDKLFRAAELIISGKVLPPRFKAHRLSGPWNQVWECHLEADWLLVYNVNKSEVCFIRTGTHADLFQ